MQALSLPGPLARLRDSNAARAVLWICTAFVVWIFPSKGIHDALVYGAFLYALYRNSKGAYVWRQPAGIAFAIVLLYMVFTLPFSLSPYWSLRDFLKFMEVVAGAFAIPVIFNTRERIRAALLYSAIAIALTLAWDLARLYYHLGPMVLAGAHSFQPFILNHSNVSSMMAGAAFFIFFHQLIVSRRRLPAAAGCAAGMLLCLAYLFVLGSRGPQAAFAAAFCCSGFIVPGRRAKLIWLLCVAIGAGALVLNIGAINSRFMERATMKNLSDRDKVWEHTAELIRLRPWFGYGYGKRNFVQVYYSTNPPEARFEFPHPHQFWLKILFEQGVVGFALQLAAWSLLAVQLLRTIARKSSLDERLLPGTVGAIILFIHLYGLGDYPDNVVQAAQFWLVPVALVIASGASASLNRNHDEKQVV